MKFNGKISISRNNHNEINIRIRDDAARLEFLDVKMTPEDFTFLITGQAHVPITGEVKGLDVVGKVKVMEERKVTTPSYMSRDRAEEWLLQNCQEEGWIINNNLGSQTSMKFNHADNNHTLNYSVYKYIETTE